MKKVDFTLDFTVEKVEFTVKKCDFTVETVSKNLLESVVTLQCGRTAKSLQSRPLDGALAPVEPSR